MNTPLSIQRLRGAAVEPHLPDLARLRSQVFRAWPYLYDASDAYESEYLAAYAASPDSVFVLASDGDAVVGAATGVPLADDADAFQTPFRAAGADVDEVFYFGESVLLPEYRGQGIGHAFFDEREAHAASLGFATTAFAAVDRDPADARAPADARDNHAFWQGRGYTRQPGLTASLSWDEADARNVPHTLTFWTRTAAAVAA